MSIEDLHDIQLKKCISLAPTSWE